MFYLALDFPLDWIWAQSNLNALKRCQRGWRRDGVTGHNRWAVWCHRKPVTHSFAAHHRAHLPVHTTHYALPQRRTQDRANEVRTRIYSSMSTCRCTLISRSWFLSNITTHLSKLYYILLCHIAQNWNRKLHSINFFKYRLIQFCSFYYLLLAWWVPLKLLIYCHSRIFKT